MFNMLYTLKIQIQIGLKNGADLDQTAPAAPERSSRIRVYTICHFGHHTPLKIRTVQF